MSEFALSNYEEELKAPEMRTDTEEILESEVYQEREEESCLPGSPMRHSLWTPPLAIDNVG